MHDPKKHYLLQFLIAITILNLSYCMVWSLNRILLNGPKGEYIKQGYLPLTNIVTHGARQALKECRYQFRWEPWNCPYGDVFRLESQEYLQGTREHAIVHAIVSAAITHQLVRNCSQGAHRACACDTSKNGRKGGYNWKWGGCSDNIANGITVSRQFLDAMETANDARAAMNLHNNEAGRKAVKKKMKRVCKCHGVSGSCTTQTCWRQLSELRSVGSFIKRRYRRAKRVNFQDGELKIDASSANVRFVSQMDLVFLDSSPDYCRSNTSVSTHGTLGRECSKGDKSSKRLEDKIEARSCHNLCRKCGYKVRKEMVIITNSCNCKFVWCCSVKCQNCTTQQTKLKCVR